MLTRVIAWSMHHRWLVLLGAAAVSAAGYFAAVHLPIDAFPDTTPVQVQVNTVCPGMVAEEIERQVTFPIELSMGGMPGLQEIRSISQFGLSQVVITFRDGTNIYLARQFINERLGNIEFPPGLPRPEMGPVSTGLGEVFHYFLVPNPNDQRLLTDAKTLQDWELKPALRSVPGTAEINAWGGLNKQFQVRVDPTKLIKYSITFDDVVHAIPRNNLNVGGGSIAQKGDAVLVHGVGRTVNAEQIGNIVLAAKDGIPIYVRDVGEVVIGHEIRRGLVTANGRGEVVLGLGFMLMGENSYAVTTRMRERFKEVSATLPGWVSAEIAYDRTELVDQVIETVKNNLCEGAFLVVFLLYILLGDLRAGLIAAASIPLAMLFGFIGMYYWGIAGSLLSLGAIDFGIVVDSSVVVIESIMRRLGHAGPVVGKERIRLIRDAATEVRVPTCFGQLIIMIVYLPILTLEGVEGKLFRPMALTVIFILVGSLILSLTFTPVLSSFVLPRKVVEREVLLIRILKAMYRPLLQLALRFRMPLLVGAGLVLLAALQQAMQMGSEFVPKLSEGAIVIGINRAPGTGLEESYKINTQIEKILLKRFPDEIRQVWSRVGTPEVATDAGGIESTDMFVTLQPRSQWTQAVTQADLVVLMERELQGIPGEIRWFTQPIEQRVNEMISGVRADIAVKIFGNDLNALTAKAREIRNVIATVPGAADVATEQVEGQPILRIVIQQDEIARYGIPVSAVLDVVESVGGKVVSNVVEGQLRFPLVVRLPEDNRGGEESLGNIQLAAPGGEKVPLAQIARIEQVRGPKTISREWSKRRVVVQCNVRGRDVGSFVAEAQSRIDAEVSLPPNDFRIEWGGQFENMQRAQQRLTIVVPLALMLILVLLYVTYQNVLDTAFLFVSVPFACVGGLWALILREMPLSISSAVGFITLSGVSVLNGMVLASALRERLNAGESLSVALPRTMDVCLRTIIMTSLVASVGFIPMAASTGTGAEVQRPLATVVIGGVMTSTIYTLVVLPVLYSVARVRGPRPGDNSDDELPVATEPHSPAAAGSSASH